MSKTSADPATPWTPAVPTVTSRSGADLHEVFPIEGPRRFFRRKAL